MIAIGLLLTVGTGLFVASEFALVSLDRNELENRMSRGERGLGPTIRALRHTSTHLSSAQLGITLTTLLTGYIFEPAVSSLLSGPLEDAGVPEALVPGIGAIVGVFLATMISMVIGELVPKNFALAVPLATARVVVPFQLLFTAVFRPLVVGLNNTANRVIRSMGIEPKEELSGARTADELGYLIRHSARSGLLEQEDATLLGRALDFSDRHASDVMTPRVRMTTVDVTDHADDVVALSRSTGFSRFPVVDGDADHVVGVVHVKAAFAVEPDLRASTAIDQLQVPALRVPESIGADTLLGRLRRAGLQFAIVADEYGGTAGMVTLEDLIEEIVGELEDEHDRTYLGFQRVGRSITFDAAWRPDELLDRTGIVVPEDPEYDTVGGFVMSRLERLPELGDSVDVDGGVLRLERVDGPRIVRLRFVPHEPTLDGEREPD